MMYFKKRSNGIIPYPEGLLAKIARFPLVLYRLGLGDLVGLFPVMIVTTKGRRTGQARTAVLEYRRHGSKYYVVSGWGKRPNWYQNLLVNPIVTVQIGGKAFRARASAVTDGDEAMRALYLFWRNSPRYDIILASMSTAHDINLRTLGRVADEFTVVRLNIEAGPLELPPVAPTERGLLPLIGAIMAIILWFVLFKRNQH